MELFWFCVGSPLVLGALKFLKEGAMREVYMRRLSENGSPYGEDVSKWKRVMSEVDREFFWWPLPRITRR